MFSKAQALIMYETTPEKLDQVLTDNPECANAIVRDETLLFLAIRSNCVMAKTLIDKMSTSALEHADDLNRTVLHVAAYRQNVQIVEILLNKMSVECVSKVDLHSCTALHNLLGYATQAFNQFGLVDKMIRKMTICSFDVEDVNHRTILDHLIESQQVYQSEINLLETRMSLDSSCRVYFRRKDERARRLLVESTRELLAKLNADVMKIVHAYIAYDTLTPKRKLAST